MYKVNKNGIAAPAFIGATTPYDAIGYSVPICPLA
jgi:hypothetical protein